MFRLELVAPLPLPEIKTLKLILAINKQLHKISDKLNINYKGHSLTEETLNKMIETISIHEGGEEK